MQVADRARLLRRVRELLAGTGARDAKKDAVATGGDRAPEARRGGDWALEVQLCHLAHVVSCNA